MILRRQKPSVELLSSGGGRTAWWLSSAGSGSASGACHVTGDGFANSNRCTGAGIRVPLCFRIGSLLAFHKFDDALFGQKVSEGILYGVALIVAGVSLDFAEDYSFRRDLIDAVCPFFCIPGDSALALAFLLCL